MSTTAPVVLLALCEQIVADESLAAIVSPDVVFEMAETIVDVFDEDTPIPTPPVPPPSVGALRAWWSLSEHQRPTSGTFFRAACYEAQSRDDWRNGLHDASYRAMFEAAHLMRIAFGKAVA